MHDRVEVFLAEIREQERLEKEQERLENERLKKEQEDAKLINRIKRLFS